MNRDADNIFTWKNFTQSSPEAQQEILTEMDLDNCLPDLPWKEQAKIFYGAPASIILKYLPVVAWEAQVKIWKDHLPVSARPQARPLLSHEAEVALKLYKHYCL